MHTRITGAGKFPDTLPLPDGGLSVRQKLQRDGTIATMLIPLWESVTWWKLWVPDAANFAEAVVEWVWLPIADPVIFVPDTAP